MSKENLTLSKSKYLSGLQCSKLLWTQYNAKEILPPVDAATQALFDQGHQVNELAHGLFPGGVEIDGDPGDFDALIAETQKALALKKPIYEGAFRYKNTFARADILKPNPDGSWDLFEVKSTTKVEDIHYRDAAFQKYCYEGAGLKIRKIFLVYIDKNYVKNGPINPFEFFVPTDITEKSGMFDEEVEHKIPYFLNTLGQKKSPEVKIGVHCGDPYECPLKKNCWSFLPPENILILNRIPKKIAFPLIHSGVLEIKDLPKNQFLSPSQTIQRDCHLSGKVRADKAEIQPFIERLMFPIYFLDFETIAPAVPVYDQSRPYQQVPFQFSLHVLSGWDQKPVHHTFLSQGQGDPRLELLARLQNLLGDKGTVLSYNMSFELKCLRESADAYPQYQEWFRGIENRFLDLIVPFRNFDYYDPKQMGRTTIKNVYPALTGGSYKDLEIGDGQKASNEYFRVIFSENIDPEDRARVLRGLEEYCRLDTQAMIDILNVLRSAIRA